MLTQGEAGVVMTGKDGETRDRGNTCIFVGYANNHGGDCYRMFNPESNRVLITRDVTWLKQMYYSPSTSTGDGKEPGVIIELLKSEEIEDKRFNLDEEFESIQWMNPLSKLGRIKTNPWNQIQDMLRLLSGSLSPDRARLFDQLQDTLKRLEQQQLRSTILQH